MLPDGLIKDVENIKKLLENKVENIDKSDLNIPAKAQQIAEARLNFEKEILRRYKFAGIRETNCDHPLSEISGEQSHCRCCKISLNQAGKYDDVIRMHVTYSTHF